MKKQKATNIEQPETTREVENLIPAEEAGPVTKEAAEPLYVYPGPHKVATIGGVTFERGKPVTLPAEVADRLVAARKIRKV